MSIDDLLVRDSESLAAALQVMDRNAFALAFAVDAQGRLKGVVEASRIAACLAAGRDPASPLADAIGLTPSFPAGTDSAAIAGQMNGSAYVLPLVDPDHRPVGLVSPGRPRRIPVAEPVLTGNELKYVAECIQTNWISSQGAFVRRFEDEFAARIGAPHALAVCNGTVALHLVLEAYGIGAGDEVIVPDLTFAATINAVLHAGATPVIVDVDAASWNLDPRAVEAAITPRTRAIMPVHLYGQPADMDALMALAGRHALVLIEDAAEAAGSYHKGRACGAIGHAGAFSFFSNKLITTGEGGMAVFRDVQAAERARVLRDHGMNPGRKYWHEEVGYNYRLTNLQAAIGCAQLEQIDRFLARKLEIAAQYRKRLGRIAGLRLPAEIEGLENSYWVFSILVDFARYGLDRAGFMERLSQAGIETRPLFYPLHQMPPYRAYAGNRAFPASASLSAQGVSLPSGVTLKDSEIAYVCDVIERCLTTRELVRSTASL